MIKVSKEKIVSLINNTGSDIRMFDSVILDCIKHGKDLPEEIVDLFTLTIFEVDGCKCGRIDMRWK